MVTSFTHITQIGRCLAAYGLNKHIYVPLFKYDWFVETIWKTVILEQIIIKNKSCDFYDYQKKLKDILDCEKFSYLENGR